MSYEIELLEVSARPVLAIRTRTPAEGLPQKLGVCYHAIGQYLGELGEKMAGAPFIAYYNLDMQDLDVEIGFPVQVELDGRGDILAGHIPGGRAVSCIYRGPYGDMEPTYNAMMEWMAERNLEPTGVAYEFYIDDPAEIPMEQVRTQIYLPLKAA